VIAFKNFAPMKGILRSPWAGSHGMQNFLDFFNSYYFGRLMANTLTISLTSLVFGFPAPIILALMLNELRSVRFKRIVQTVTYMPHFISMVVICSMIRLFCAENGVITNFLQPFGIKGGSLLSHSEYFVPLYVLTGIWQEIGWGSIIYLAALTGIDQELYEAAHIDGAGRWRQTLHVTLPGISSTIIILLILRMGSVMSVGYEKIILLYNDSIMDKADVISSFVYRRGLLNYEWSYSSAVGLFNSVINFILIVLFNRLSRAISDTSLW
ncbi:MAG TPA: ABC transporter permease subunit, partial [Clostridia bacterium]|nr:ABC transporter permease subunit [Clostridia bacterium]